MGTISLKCPACEAIFSLSDPNTVSVTCEHCSHVYTIKGEQQPEPPKEVNPPQQQPSSAQPNPKSGTPHRFADKVVSFMYIAGRLLVAIYGIVSVVLAIRYGTEYLPGYHFLEITWNSPFHLILIIGIVFIIASLLMENRIDKQTRTIRATKMF